MKSERDIEIEIKQHERELEDLLQRVMQKPFEPITESVRDVYGRLDLVEKLVRQFMDDVLGSLNDIGDESNKKIRALNSRTEEMPEEVKKILQPLLETKFESLNQSHQSTVEQIKQHSDAAAERASLAVRIKITALDESIVGLQATLSEQLSQLQRQQSAWPDRIAEQRSALEQMQEFLEQSTEQKTRHVIDTLIVQLDRQTDHSLQSLANLQKDMTARTEMAKQSSDATLERTAQDVVSKVSELTNLTAKLQDALAVQENQLIQLHRQQAMESARLAEQVTRSLMPIKRWLITAVFLMSSGLIGGAALALHQYY